MEQLNSSATSNPSYLDNVSSKLCSWWNRFVTSFLVIHMTFYISRTMSIKKIVEKIIDFNWTILLWSRNISIKYFHIMNDRTSCRDAWYTQLLFKSDCWNPWSYICTASIFTIDSLCKFYCITLVIFVVCFNYGIELQNLCILLIKLDYFLTT